MVEFIEVFKNETEYLHTMITATQEKFVPAPAGHGTIYVDTCIVAHSSEAEWRSSRPTTPTRRSWTASWWSRCPTTCAVRRGQDLPQVPRPVQVQRPDRLHTLEIASMFAVLSRLEPTPKCDLMTKLKIYNGEEVLEEAGRRKLTVHELREDAKREGLFGISTRFIMKALDTALTRNGGSIHPISVREALIGMVKEADSAEDTKKRTSNSCRTRCTRSIWSCSRRTSPRPSSGLQGQAETLFHNYLDHAEAYVTRPRSRTRSPATRCSPTRPS